MNFETLYIFTTKCKMGILVLVCSLLCVQFAEAQEDEKEKTQKAMSVESTLLKSKIDTLHPAIKKGSIIPVPIIITEPALGGFGGGLALGYLHSNRKSLRKDTPPTISGIFGGITANNSWLVGGGHSHSWDNDRIRYLGGLAKGVVNLTFYDNLIPNREDSSFDVEMDVWGTIQNIAFRIANSNLFVGPQYTYLSTKNSLDVNTGHPRLDSLANSVNGRSRLGMLGLLVQYDSRDNTMSPNKGLYAGGTFYYNATFFGGDTNFFRPLIYAKYYFAVSEAVYGGIRFDGQFTSGDVPFYAKPFVALRGVPAMRYQGNDALVAETQWRWQFYKGLSVLGFVGTGKAMDKLSDFGDQPWIYNYGGGLRYALKQAFGVRVGADVAWSNEDFAWYISVGSSF